MERLKNLLTSVCQENTVTHQDKVIERQNCKVQPCKAGDLVRIRLNAVQKNARGGKKISPRIKEQRTVHYNQGDGAQQMDV